MTGKVGSSTRFHTNNYDGYKYQPPREDLEYRCRNQKGDQPRVR